MAPTRMCCQHLSPDNPATLWHLPGCAANTCHHTNPATLWHLPGCAANTCHHTNPATLWHLPGCAANTCHHTNPATLWHLPGCVFQLADLLGGPRGQGLGFLHLGAAALRQQVLDGVLLQQGHDAHGERHAQVPEHEQNYTWCFVGLLLAA